MDINKAQESLNQAEAAQAASSRPILPVGLGLVSAIAAGVGVALVGQSPDQEWAQVLALVGGIALMGAAFLLPASYRARHGLHGFRGRVRSDNVVFFVCAVSLVICGRGATDSLSAIYLGIGGFVAVVYFLLLRGRLGSA